MLTRSSESHADRRQDWCKPRSAQLRATRQCAGASLPHSRSERNGDGTWPIPNLRLTRRRGHRVNAAAPAVHVDARHKLGEQPEADQHDARLNQYRAQEQQRPMLEKHGRTSDELRPENPGTSCGAGSNAAEANRTEKVQGTRDVAQQEPDGDEIGGNAPRP